MPSPTPWCSSYRKESLRVFIWLYAGKGKKQKLLCTNDYGCELHWWYSASAKYTYPVRIPAAYFGNVSRWHRSPCQRKQNRVHGLQSKRRQMENLWNLWTSSPTVEAASHLPKMQRHEQLTRVSVIWKSELSDKIKRSFPSKQRSYHYYCIDAPHGRWLSVWRESFTEIAQECYELYWTSPRGNITQSSCCMATYHPSRKPSKLDQICGTLLEK